MAPDQDHDQDNSQLDDTQKYFFKCMVGDFREKMDIPQKFVENFKGHISELIKLEAPDGNIYNVQAIRDLNKIVLGSGWGVFVSFYKLKVGYFLVFRYIGDSHFKVLIFDFGTCCEKEVFHVLMNCGPNAQEKESNSESHRRCELCDVHFYWHHLDDRQKHFLRLMVGDFRQEMSIPQKFVNNFRGRISEVMKLEAPDGNIYNFKVTKDLNKIVLRYGWAAFASDYELKEHDLLVFRYIGDSHFKVLIFDPSGCEKQLFHIVLNHAPNVPKTGISHDRSFIRETRRRDCGSHDNNSRKTKKMTPVDSPSPRSEGVTSPEVTMNSGGLWEITEPHYVLATGCNLTTAQKAEVDALVKKVRPVIPFYITAMNKTSMSVSLVICKDYAAKYLPHEDQFITLCHPHKSNIWVDNLKVITDGSCMLSVGWSCFVLHNELRESDICLFEVSKNDGEVTMVVHSLEGGHHLQGKEPESQNKCGYPVKVEMTEEEESDKEHAESNYYYSRYAYDLTGEEQEEIFRSTLIQQGNPVYVAVLQENHVSSRNNLLTFPREFAAKHLAERSHDILLLRPNRREKWCVRYYYHSMMRIQGFSYRSWTKFVCDNRLHEGHVCVFELMKGVCKATMMVHVFRKFNGRFVLLD